MRRMGKSICHIWVNITCLHFRCTRVYWSTKDARRRCIYTCTVREVHPEALKSPVVPIKDMRIIHDETHPEYVPISQLNLSEMGIDIAKKEADVSIPSDSSVVDLTSASDVLDFTGHNEQSTQMSMNTSEETLSHVGPLSSSFGGKDSKKLSTSASLSESWPGAKAPEKQSPYSVDLTVLSPSTQKLLNMTNLKKYATSENNPKEESDDCGLLKIANRLNRAAARGRSRQSSEERSLTPVPHTFGRCRSSSFNAQSIPRPFTPPARMASPTVEGSMISRPFSPPFRMRSRSPSVEKTGSPLPFISPVSGVELGGSRASSVDRVVPARPFSPPLRMPHRARSASLEKTCFAKALLSSDTVTKLSENRKVTIYVSEKIDSSSNKSASPAIDMVISPVSRHSTAVSSSSMDEISVPCGNIVTLTGQFGSPDPKPISASSPLESKTKSKYAIINETQDASECILIDTSQLSSIGLGTSELESSRDESESMGMSQKLEDDVTQGVEAVSAESDDLTDNGTGTVVIMTDSTEDITEDEAILIAQAAIEQSSGSDSHVLANGNDDCDKGSVADKNENTENDKEKAEPVDVLEDGKSDSKIESPVRPIDNEMEESVASSDSPFIPKIIEQPDDKFLMPEISENKTLRKAIESDEKANDLNVEDEQLKVKDEDYQTANSPLTPVLISTDSDDSDSEIVDITESIVQATVKAADMDLESGRKTSTDRIDEKNIEIIDSDIEILDSIGSGAVGLSKNSQEIETNNFTKEADRMPELERFDVAGGNSGVQIQPIMGTKSEAEEKLFEIGVENAQTVNTDDEIDGQSAPISSLSSFTDGFKTDDNSEKLHLIPLSRSESSEALHVDIIEDIDSDTESISQPVVTITPEKEGSSNSMDKNIFERMKQFSCTGSLEAEKDDRSEAEKHEIMRGLGLERSEDVEKAKKSPKSSQSPLKTYPLRKNMMSPLRYRDTDNGIGFGRKGKETNLLEEEHGSLPVLDPIAKKIKLESLAKSSTDARGPFRCETCKRSYRTETSLQLHSEKCDFEVSTSEEDDSDTQADQSSSRRTRKKTHKDRSSGSTVSGSNRSSLRRSTMDQRVALEVEMKRLQEENVPKKRGRPSLSAELEATPGRFGSPVSSRLSSRKVLQNVESAKPYKISTQQFPRGRGRPRKFGIISSKNLSPEKGKCGRHRQNGGENLQTSVKSITKNLKSREKLVSQKHPSTLLMNARNLLRQKILSKRGRPGKNKDADSPDMPILTKTGDSDISVDEKAAPNHEEEDWDSHSQQQTNSKYSLRHARRSGRFDNNSDEMPVLERSPPGISNRNTDTEADDEPPVLIKLVDNKETSEASNPVCKRGRGRPSKGAIDDLDNTKDTLHNDGPSFTTGQKRDLPSLRKEVENFRKIKKLKRDSSQESADVIEIDSSDGDADENTPSSNNTDDILQSSEINGQTVTEKGVNIDGSSKKENSIDLKNENERNMTDSISIGTPSQTNETKHVETDMRVYCDDSIITSKSDVEHRPSRIRNDSDILGNDIVGDIKAEQNHSNDPVTNDLETKNMAQCHQNQNLLKTSIKSEELGHNLLESVQNDEKDSELNVGQFDVNKKSVDTSEIGNKDRNANVKEETENIVLGNSEVPGCEKSSLSASRSGQLKGGQGGEESESVAANSSLSNTVLKLLKDGHKVLIKNPKLGKSFLWEKTEKGYVGRPYEKDIKGQSTSSVPRTTATVSTCSSATVTNSNMKLHNNSSARKDDSMTKLKPFSGPSSTTSSLRELLKINDRISESAEEAAKIQKLPDKEVSEIQKAPDSQIRQSTASQVLFSYFARQKEMQQKTATATSPKTDQGCLKSSSQMQKGNNFIASSTSCTSDPGSSQTYSRAVHSSVRPISVVTQSSAQLTCSTRSTLPKLSPIQSVSSRASVAMSSVSSRASVAMSSVSSRASIARSSVSPQFIGQPQILQTQQTVLQSQQTSLQSQQIGLQGQPVSNLLPNIYAPNVSPQIGISSTVVPQSVNLLMTNQPQNALQTSYPNQLAVSQPLTIQLSPQQSTYKPIIVRQVPYVNQMPVIVPVGPQAGLSGTVVPKVQDAQSVFQPLLPNTVTQIFDAPVGSNSPSTSSTTVSTTARNRVLDYLLKKDETDTVKNLQNQSNPDLSAYPYSDALKATASLANPSSIESQQRDLRRQFTNVLKAHRERESIYFQSRMKDFYLGRKYVTSKSTAFSKNYPGEKSVFRYKKKKYGVPGQHTRVSQTMPKGQSVAEKTVLVKTTRPYRKRLGNKSPLKKKKGRPSQLKTKIEGPHSLGENLYLIMFQHLKLTAKLDQKR